MENALNHEDTKDAKDTKRTVYIDKPQALAQLVCDSTRQAMPIVDYGLAHSGIGHPPPTQHVKLVQHGGILEHYASDMTVRAAAGITLSDLQETLRPHHQFVPIDADDDVTLGEAIMHNVYGPLRVTYGSLRDLLLGLHYIDGQGRDIHVGGRTVKNVAGYDVTRFMVGSLGEYGLVYEATLRTYALPQQVTSVQLHVNDPQVIDQVLGGWLITDAAPAAAALEYEEGQWTLQLAYFGCDTGCTTQLDSLKKIVHETSALRIVSVDSISFDACRQLGAQQRAWRRKVDGLVKIVVPPVLTGRICDSILQHFGAHLRVAALPVHGCIFAGVDMTAQQAGQLHEAIRLEIQTTDGLWVWYNRPPGTQTIAPFNPPQADGVWLDKLKRTFDPHGILNPGRSIKLKEQDS